MAAEAHAPMAFGRSAAWHPVARSSDLRAGENIVAAWAAGHELAVWRSSSGVAQAFDNRCPHRSVRLSLGHIADDRLVCGYHGWQWCAGSGACAAIPAHPGMQLPDISVRTHKVHESDGLVWVMLRLDDGSLSSELPVVEALPPASLFCRALTLRRGVAVVESGLLNAGWSRPVSGWNGTWQRTWQGTLGGCTAHAVLLDAQMNLCIAWLWLSGGASPTQHRQALVDARALRATLESA